MNDPNSQNDEAEIRTPIEHWAKAVREQNRTEIRADHDPRILMFDVPPTLLSRGLEAYIATWETFFSSAEKSVALLFTMCRSLAAGMLPSSRHWDGASTWPRTANANLLNLG
jgi:ketosteroid isomerase-like protein